MARESFIQLPKFPDKVLEAEVPYSWRKLDWHSPFLERVRKGDNERFVTKAKRGETYEVNRRQKKK